MQCVALPEAHPWGKRVFMVKALSHLVVATKDVPKMGEFVKACFGLTPHFEHKEFIEFVLPTGFRIAFFAPVGKAAQWFTDEGERGVASFGITVGSVDEFYASIEPKLETWGARVSGPPKDHPWGEKSFLLVDPEGNRWEVTQSPSKDGMLVNRD